MGMRFRTSVFRPRFFRTSLSGIVAVLIVTASGWFCPLVSAQNFAVPPVAPENEAETSSGIPVERRVNQQLETLSEAGRAKNLAEVRETLDLLCGADPMTLVPDRRGIYVPLHRDLVQRLQSMDSEFLKNLETTSGKMESQIDRGLMQGPESLLRATHEAAGTRSAWLGHFLLATIHHDRGNSLAAQYWLRPLLTPVIPDDIRVAAEELSDRILASQSVAVHDETAPTSNSKRAVTAVTGEPAKKTTPSDAAQPEAGQPDAGKREAEQPDTTSDTREESATKSNSAINGASSVAADDFKAADGEAPSLFVHWMQRISLSEAERRVSQDLVRRSADRSMIPWTAWEPVADDQYVFIRTPYLIKAFERQTGSHLWTKVIQRRSAPMEDFPPGFSVPSSADNPSGSDLLRSTEVRTVHRNELVGRMTADEERVLLFAKSWTGSR